MTVPQTEILVISPLLPRQMAAVESAYTVHRLDLAADKDALIAEVADRVSVIITSGGRATPADLIAKLPKLALVSTSSVGVDLIDLAACRERGIVVTNTPGVLTDDVADLTLGLLIATERRMVEGDRWVRSDAWKTQGMFPLTRSLTGRKVGILGLGAIGIAIANRCQAFRMEIGYSTRTKRDVSYPYFDNALALAEWSDIMVLALPGGAATQHIVDGPVIDAIGADGSLINIARGSVVDEEALIAALESGRLGAAGLDVFASEPAADRRLAAMDNVVLSPHHASGTVTTRDAMAQMVVDNIAAWLETGTALTPVAAG